VNDGFSSGNVETARGVRRHLGGHALGLSVLAGVAFLGASLLHAETGAVEVINFPVTLNNGEPVIDELTGLYLPAMVAGFCLGVGVWFVSNGGSKVWAAFRGVAE